MVALGGLEAVASSIGDELTELGGYRFTILTADTAAGATTINVETTLDWPAAGKLRCSGQLYTYTSKTPTTFVGLSPAFVAPQPALTRLADASRTFSGIDLAKNMLFVDTAEGAYLDALGRNYGLARSVDLTDPDFRKLIKAIAFAPKGTVFSLELALDAILGAGNYSIFEDLVNRPHEVFIIPKVTDVSAAFKSYLDVVENVASASTTTVVATTAPLGGSRDSVMAVHLAPDFVEVTGGVRPSAEPVPWTYGGGGVENTQVTVNADGSVKITDADNATNPNYSRTMRISGETGVIVEANLHVNSVAGAGMSTLETQTRAFIEIDDNVKLILVGFDATFMWVVKTDGMVLYSAPFSGRHAIRIVKPGGIQNAAPSNATGVEIYVDNSLFVSIPYSSFSAGSAHRVRFGSRAVAGISNTDWYDLRVSTDDATNFWNLRSVGAGAVLAADVDELTDAAAPWVAADAGQQIELRNGAVKHGRNSGRYKVATVEAAGVLTLSGLPYGAGQVTAFDRFKIGDENNELFEAIDVGLQAVLLTGTGANGIKWTARYGSVDGNAITVKITATANHPTIQVNVTAGAGAIRHVEVIPVANAGAVITSTAAQVVAAVLASTSAAAMISAAVTGSGLGAVVAVAQTNLAGGEDGKILTVSGSGAGNNGSRNLATLIDDHTVLLGTHNAIPALTLESGLTWKKDPNFFDESGLEYEIAAGGTTLTSPTLTLRRALYTSPLLLELHYSVKDSGEIEGGIAVDGSLGARRPLYLLDRLAFLQDILDGLVVAGVFARLQR